MVITSDLALLLIPVLPLAAGLLVHLFLRRSPRAAAWTGILGLLGSAGFAGQLLPGALAGHAVHWERPWIDTAALQLPLALNTSLAPLLFILTTALLAAAVLGYALRERRADPHAARFYANLTLFAGSMLLLLCADTLLLLYAAWELLGLFSFVLIAHSGSDEAKRAARQAFWTTRATDMGLLFAVLIMMVKFGWPTLSAVDLGGLLQTAVKQLNIMDLALVGQAIAPVYAWLGLALLLILLAVAGKSAQWPLSFWLADAMVAPAPVSALLHAATLVAAGPYLIYSLFPLMLPNQIALPHSTEALSLAPQLMLALLSLLGALSLVCGGLMAYHAREPKRVLAYSTVSQLGLCLCGYGVFAGHAAYFQLLAHAWCKAALFLGVGMLAAQWQRQGHASTEAPGLRELAGSARRAPVVQAALVLAAAALAGIPLLGSAPGKEQILWAVWSRAMTTAPGFRGTLGEAFPVLAGVWLASAVLLVIGLALTAAYLTRLVGLLAWARPLAGPEPVPAPADPADGLAPAAAEREGGWSGASLLTLALAVIGSLGTAALYFYLFEPHYHTKGTAWLWMPAGSTSLLVTAGALALTLLGAAVAWSACVAPQLRPSQPPLRRGSTLAGFFANGMYLREFWHGAVGSAGYALAVLAGRTERSVLDATVERTGRFGRALAACSAWVDRHVVDGLRWQACEFWWRIRRLHSRWLQTGDLQQYMFAILAGAVILCIVVIRPLSHIFARVLERPQ